MDQATYVDIFDYVLREQDDRGFWTVKDTDWAVVMTAVVLKALAELCFKPGNWWPTETGTGGITNAVRFLASEVEKKGGKPGTVGEDIWDDCQAAIALNEFGESAAAEQMADKINLDWKNLYRTAWDARGKNRWCSPAYLAAMVDVLGYYDGHLQRGNFAEALDALKKSEALGPQNSALGFFPAATSRADMDVWSTSLVLRTLSAVPSQYEHLTDREQVQRVAIWLLDKLPTDTWRSDQTEIPMLLARSLHGLRAAWQWVDGPTRDRIDAAVKSGNDELGRAFRHKPRRGNLKSYTAVVEYLSTRRVPAPAGLVFHARKSLASSTVANMEPKPLEGGLRIVWLSDLHVGSEDKTRPRMALLKRLVRASMFYKGTPLTEHFASRNVNTILNRVRDLKPNHILVTGDLTDFAQASQFKFVHDRFLTVQSAINRGGAIVGDLDPDLWTILPGNHDVTDEEAGNDGIRPTLARFFQFFARTYRVAPGEDYRSAFPILKRLKAPKGSLTIRLLGLDSTVTAPVWVVGINARGRIDQAQRDRLSEMMNENPEGALTVIALHHHPIVVPELLPAAQDYFLSLNESDGRKLVQAAAASGVRAILHGHFHRFSSWSGLTPDGKTMTIVGSAAGTLNIPNTDEGFLELREAERETPVGLQQGLALYAQRLIDAEWVVNYSGIFLTDA